MFKKLQVLLLSLILIFNFGQVFAEDIPVIVIAPSKKAQSISTVGTSVTVLDENFFKNSNEFFLGDALADNSTSANFFQSGGHGTASAIQLRGLPKRYSTVYIDGVKMSDPSSVSNDFDFNHILTSQVSRVEILKGNQSSVYGSGAIGGTINITTKKGEAGFQKNVQYNTASHGTHDLSVALSGADENDNFYIGLERFQTDGLSAMTHNDEKDRYRNNSLVANYGRQLSDKIEFESNLRIAETYLQYDAEDNNPADKSHAEEVDAVESSSNVALIYKPNEKFTNKFTAAKTYIKRSYGPGDGASFNTVKDNKERIGRMLLMHANHREDIKVAYAGDIVAIAGLKDTITGETLSDSNKPIVLESMDFPDPVIEIAVEPKTKADQEKMGEALARLAKEDPSFRVSSDDESGQTVIKGMGELHLDIIVDRMKREFNVEANVGAPQVAYRETISKEVEVTYTHKKQSGGAGQFAEVKMIVEGGEPGSGRIFEDKIKGGNIPKEYIPGVEKGVEGVADTGVIAGFPIIDYKVTLIDGKYHDVDSSSLAFEIAGRMGFKDACNKASPKLLEPVMRVEVVTPDDFMGDVIGDLSSRRAQVSGSEARGNTTTVSAMVPLANMFGYINTLRSMTQGRAQYSMFFDHYEQVPQNVQDEVKAKFA